VNKFHLELGASNEWAEVVDANEFAVMFRGRRP
jgi:hypothetical protein